MVESSRADGWNVLELSSFQIETMAEFRAHIALALNVTANHLDRHHTFENYAAAKARLFETQRSGDFAVLNAEDPVCARYADGTRATAQWFSSRREVSPGASLRGERWCGRPPADGAGEIPIRGRHNVENVLRGDCGGAGGMKPEAIPRGAHVPGVEQAGVRAEAERRRFLQRFEGHQRGCHAQGAGRFPAACGSFWGKDKGLD